MKKSFVYIALFIFNFTAFSVAEEQVELLPEVKALITPKPLDPKLLENNRFIALLGATYAKDDYYNVAKTAFAKDYLMIYKTLFDKDMLTTEEINQLSLELSKIYSSTELLQWKDSNNFAKNTPFCVQYKDDSCINKILNHKEQIQKVLIDNQSLIQRYDDIFSRYPISQTLFFPSEASVVTPLPAYHNLLNIFKIQLANSVVLISDDEIDEGIELLSLLQRRINQMVYLAQKNNLIDVMIAGAMQQALDQYLDALLNSYSDSLLSHQKFDDLMMQHEQYSQKIHQSTMRALQNEVALTYMLIEPIWAMKKIAPQEINKYYETMNEMEMLYQNDPYGEKTKQRIKSICNDLRHEVLLMNCLHPIWQSGYLERNDTQRNYHNMIYLKYLIMKNQIPDTDIAEFLDFQSEITQDLITNKKFQWDLETRTISLPLGEYKYVPATIRKTMSNNSKIKNLQVKLP